MTAPASPAPAAFAIPGDIERKTGGFIYERNLLAALRDAGRDVLHVALPAGFPDPTARDTAEARAALTALPASMPVIIDGLVYGAIDTAVLADMAAPIVAMIHHPLGLETGLSPARSRGLLRREADNLARAARVVVPSPHTARILRSSFGVDESRIAIAAPGFPRPRSRPEGVARRSPPLILSVGLLAARKGHDTLLEALAGIADIGWTARIVGGTHDPDVAAALGRQRRALGLEDRVTLAGEVSASELAALYRAATVFALATRYEGYGMAFAEAMSFGLPIVGCAVGAVPDTVAPEAGLLVPPDAPDAFADALRRLLTDDGLRRRAAAASAQAGAELPTWADAAAVAGRVLDELAV